MTLCDANDNEEQPTEKAIALLFDCDDDTVSIKTKLSKLMYKIDEAIIGRLVTPLAKVIAGQFIGSR